MTAPTLKLDLACGQNKQPGFLGVDAVATKDTDLVFDLTQIPWPWADGSVAEVHCSHFFEHLTGAQRIDFMHELYRILPPGGKATIIVPYARSDGALQDPTHQWPPVLEQTFTYFSAEGRRSLNVEQYPIHCDFNFEIGMALTPEWQNRSQAERLSALRHFWNVASEMVVYMTRV